MSISRTCCCSYATRDRYPFTAPRTRSIPVPVRVFVQYGLLMLLPQSSAFIPPKPTERCQFCRTPAHSTQTARPSALSSRTELTVGVIAKCGRYSGDEIKWPELLAHFRTVQTRHERARRAVHGSAPEISSTLPPRPPNARLHGNAGPE